MNSVDNMSFGEKIKNTFQSIVLFVFAVNGWKYDLAEKIKFQG